jgi:hypothetical protein
MRLKFNFTNKRESTKPSVLVAVDLVQAARFWGGQLLFLAGANMSRYLILVD